MQTTRKFKLKIVSGNKNEAYQFIRNEIYQQQKALNTAYNHLYFEQVAAEKIKEADEEYKEFLKKFQTIAQEKFQEYMDLKQKAKESAEDELLQKKVEKAKKAYEKAQENVTKVEKEFSKKPGKFSKKRSALKTNTAEESFGKRFDLHYDTVDRIVSKVIKDFNDDVKKGVLQGKRSLRNYKIDKTVMIRARSMRIYKENDDYFLKMMNKWGNGIVFKIIVSAGSKQKANINELKSVLERIINREYKVCDSTIRFDKKLILNVTVDIPVSKENVFIPGRVVGVDLGLNIRAYVSLNDNPKIKKAIRADDFLAIREQIQRKYRRLQKSLEITRGGKGRKKKLKALERLKAKERNFVRLYNEFISKKIIQFAVKNKAGVIHMEELKFDSLKYKSLLRNWSYYELQEMIENKAKREGITVYYVDSKYTSQTCSNCGNLEEGQRDAKKTQGKFMCKKCGFVANADFNASQNIAKSTEISKKTKPTKTDNQIV